MQKVLVLGYYNRQNFGDDLFQFVFNKYIFPSDSYELTILNIDDLETLIKSDSSIPLPFDLVVLGGGDIINDYFLSNERIQEFRTYFADIPIVFLSVGISYPSLLPLMDIGDAFYIRNEIDYKDVKERFGNDCVSYIPDVSFLINKETSLNTYHKTTTSISKIGVCFPYTWFANVAVDNNSFYQELVSLLSILAQKYQLYLIPFDVSPNQDNSDLLLLSKLRESLQSDPNFQKISFMDSNLPIDMNRMIDYFKSLDCVIASRYHSVLLSMFTETPFIALYSTRKVDNIKSELNSQDILQNLFIKINTDDNYIPQSFDQSNVLNMLSYITANTSTVQTSIKQARETLCAALDTGLRSFQNWTKIDKYLKIRCTPPQYISETDKQVLIGNTITNVLQDFGKLTVRNIQRVYNGVPLINVVSKRNNTSDALQQYIAEEILWTITGDPYAPYYYGLFDSAHQQELIPQLEWVISDYYEKFYFKSIQSDKLQIVNKNFQELHRSGWQYIVDHIILELNHTLQITESVIIDTYVDKTFHWNCEFYKSKNLIPYTDKWIGFIHHTYSYYNNNYNCEELFKNPVFLQSLQTCKCLIVMSKYLKAKIENSLEALYNDKYNPLTNRIAVEVVYHPSEVPDITFDWNTFSSVQNKQVVQIGNWLRDVFGIYKLPLPQTSMIKQKSILKNRNSENYFLPDGFLDNLLAYMKGSVINGNIYDICKISFDNMHLKGMYEYIVEAEESVTVLDYLNNDQYDVLLSTSIVFLDLVDASAVNTLVECIIRNTPILINPIDPVVEVLGENYPLYYRSMYEASKLLDDPTTLQAAHNYLVSMDKTRFMISTFVAEIKNIMSRYIN